MIDQTRLSHVEQIAELATHKTPGGGKPHDGEESGLGHANLGVARRKLITGEAGPFELVRSLETKGRNVTDLHAVLARADEFKFSGGANMATRLDAEERRKIVRAILEVCR